MTRPINGEFFAGAPGSTDEQFDSWWALWDIPGTKRGKGAARRAFKTALKVAPYDEICRGTVAYMAWCRAENQSIRFTKHPSTFLCGECWADELVPSKPPDPSEEAKRRHREANRARA